MKQKSKNKSRKWVYWVVCLALLVVAGGTAYVLCDAFWERDTSEQKQDVLDGGTDEEKEQTLEGIEGIEDDENKESGDSEEPPKKVTQYEGEDPNKAGELTGTITYAGVAEGNLMIRTNIDQFLGEGDCELVIQRGGVTVYSATSGIAAGASTSACEGFDVPVATVGSGAAQIVINLSSGDKTGILTTEVEL